ncbi:MAG TPA: CIA30 family protein [Opitutae bacterium]|nr:CIA30 family protein [Opitutae bacterium]
MFIRVVSLSLLLVANVVAESMKPLFQFTGESPSNPWVATNDGVMGGLSKGGAILVEEGMLFSGTLSLENNGGFSSVYASGSYDLSDHQGLRFSVLGDGRSYELRLNSDALYRAGSPVSFRQTFDTVEGEWIEVFVPFNELKQSWRGRELNGYALNTADIRRIGLMLADKQPGKFALKVRWVSAE